MSLFVLPAAGHLAAGHPPAGHPPAGHPAAGHPDRCGAGRRQRHRRRIIGRRPARD